VKLKREVAALERAVFVKEKEHEQDSVVKIQLGKRLEQVLLDKEEAYEELEQLQVLYLYSATPTNSTLPLPHVASTYCSLSFRKYVQHHLTALTIHSLLTSADQAVHIEERDVQHGLQGHSSGGSFSCKKFSCKEVKEKESQHNMRGSVQHSIPWESEVVCALLLILHPLPVPIPDT
jgi:hypothetical protein